MKGKLQANGNAETIYDFIIHAHTLSSMFCLLCALQGARRLIQP